MNLNLKQSISIFIVIFSVLAISTTNLTEIFGPHMAKVVASAANMVNAMLAGILGVITGQAAMVKDVAAMPGIEPLKINAQANSTLAAIATDPDQPNVGGVTPQVQARLQEIAKG